MLALANELAILLANDPQLHIDASIRKLPKGFVVSLDLQSRDISSPCLFWTRAQGQ
jgi:hypothetical protein